MRQGQGYGRGSVWSDKKFVSADVIWVDAGATSCEVPLHNLLRSKG